MGEAVVKNLQVGILAAFPGTRPIDGLLGGGFLEHFTLTLDYRAKRLQLTPALSGRRGAEDYEDNQARLSPGRGTLAAVWYDFCS